MSKANDTPMEDIVEQLKARLVKTTSEQLNECTPDWEKLVTALIPTIGDDYRASDDPDDDTPGMCLTIGFTPETEEKDYSWGWQTGDNSFTVGAYSHPHWAVVSLYRDSVAKQVAQDCVDQIADLVWQSQP